METSGGHGGLIVHNAPCEYERTPQQKRFKAAAKHCGVKKGMKRLDLLIAMKECIPQYWRDHAGKEEPEEQKEEQSP